MDSGGLPENHKANCVHLFCCFSIENQKSCKENMMTQPIERVRTITWENPKNSARDASMISGLDYLKSILDGKIAQPPIAKLVGYRIADVEEGKAVFELTPGEYHYNPFATVHGGITTTLLDTTLTAAVLSTLPVGLACFTIEIKVNFLRQVSSVTGKLTCIAEMTHSGSRIAVASGRVMDIKNELYATAVSTCMIIKS